MKKLKGNPPSPRLRRARSRRKIRRVRQPVLGSTLDRLYRVIDERLRSRPEGSYTVKLTTPDPAKRKSGLDKVLEKIGEESTEVVLAAKGAPASFVVKEVADLMYHLMVMMRLRRVTPGAVAAELRRRELPAGRR